MTDMHVEFISYARSIYGDGFIPLHRPVFKGNEKQYLNECVDSNFVSSVGQKVIDFEDQLSNFTGAKYAVATSSGTSALHIAMILAGVKPGDEVITQAVTFVATCNAIRYQNAYPVFIDVDLDTCGMSPRSLRSFLEKHAYAKRGRAYNKDTGRRIAACVPMHTFGMPCKIKQIAEICDEWGVTLIEDCAEALGSYDGTDHVGTNALVSTYSFNGNKIITTGGGGMITTDNIELAKRAKHLTTTAKVAHKYEFVHDEIGYNYRMPNLNAAIGCAQMECLPDFLSSKQKVANLWKEFCSIQSIKFFNTPKGLLPNNWLNAFILESKLDRDNFLNYSNENGVMTRPLWRLMSELKMFADYQMDDLKNSNWLQDRLVNVPSSVPE